MISVIVPFWNAEGWLARCLDSLMAQKGDCEFVLVDDRSTDGSALIARDYVIRDDRFILIRNKHKQGPGGARNTGIEASEGDWITFLDADDEMLPRGIMIYEAAIKAHGSHRIIQANSLRHYAKINKTVLRYSNEEGIYDINRLPEQWCMVWNKVYRRNLIENIRFEEDMRFGEDELFNLECLAIEKHIKHLYYNRATIKRHFDNKSSLSKSKTKTDLLNQIHALEAFMLRQSDADVCSATLDLLSEHWNSNTYRSIFCGEK